MNRICWLTALFCFQGVTAPSMAADSMNVIVLLVDDWGWTDATCQGSDLYRTPNIDRFAADGVVFTNGYAACTVCSPTRAAMMTGMYPGRTRVTDFITGGQPANAKLMRPDWMQRIEKRHTTLAEALKKAGYRTGHVGKWHLMPRGEPDMNDYLPRKHGFDINIGGNEWGAPGSYFHPYGSARCRVGVLPAGGREGDYLTDRLTNEALKIYPHYHSCGATPHSAIRSKHWRLIEFFEDNHVELYDLNDDIGETNNLNLSMPDKAAELRTRLHAWRKSVGAQLPTANPNYDPSAGRKRG